MKTCSRCQQEKPRDQFARSSQTRDGLQNYCRACATEARKLYREGTPHKEYAREPAISLAELKRDVRRVAKLLGHRPTQTEYATHGRFSEATLRNRLGGSWRSVIESCGLRYELKHPSGIPSDDELRRDLERVRDQLGRPPNYTEYTELGRYFHKTLIRRAGGRRWLDALVHFLGLDRDEAGRYSTHDPARYRTTAERLEELRALAQRLGHSPTEIEAKKHGLKTHQLRARTGMNWLGILEEAGLPPPLSPQSVRAVRARQKQEGETQPQIQAKSAQLSEVPDPVRDFLKEESVEAIKEFFQKREKK